MTKLSNKYWEMKNPGFIEDVVNIFGSDNPSSKEVAAWKESWRETTSYRMNIEGFDSILYIASPGIRELIHQVCCDIGIERRSLLPEVLVRRKRFDGCGTDHPLM